MTTPDRWWNRLSGLWRRPDDDLGRRGERVAARWLRRRGYRILERNLTLGRDEVDLLVTDPDRRTVVIVEVKTRSTTHHVPEEGVGKAKQQRLIRAAARLQRRRQFLDRPFRFDVIAIDWPESGEPDVRHHVGAFDAPF